MSSPEFAVTRDPSGITGSHPVRSTTRHGGRPAPPSTAVALLRQARRGLTTADHAATPAEKYCGAHLAALRAAAAALAVRARPRPGNYPPTSVWALLATAAPEFAEWAAFFAAGSAIRSAVDAGVTRLVSARTADDLVRQAGQFVELVERMTFGVR